MKGGYDGRSLTGRRIILLGEEDIFLWEISLWGFWVWSLILVDFGESKARGTSLLGVFGTGARISLWYPRARESDRLLLAGREENMVLGSV